MHFKEDVIGRNKWLLDTPCLVIDRKLLQQNLLTMQAFANSTRKKLRPHCKTHKCSKIANLQVQTGAFGVAVAKVSEARGLVKAGLRNILITSPITTHYKLHQLALCFEEEPDITVVVDNAQNAEDLNNIAQRYDHELNILIDINPGLGRTGIEPQNAVEFARKIIRYSHLNLLGIQCYAGNLQHIVSYHERRECSLAAMSQARDLIKQLYAARIETVIFSGSGTGTYDIDASIPEVTELQPGSYVVMDADYSRIETASTPELTLFKPALSLLTTVISANHRQHVTLDAGIKALYLDATAPRVLHPNDAELTYQWGYGDEHGKLSKPADYDLPVNKVVELMVAHCDPTINLFDQFYVTQDDIVIDIWPIDLRGCSQ